MNEQERTVYFSEVADGPCKPGDHFHEALCRCLCVRLPSITKIQAERLKYIIKNSIECEALHNGGVDNWEWYSESMRDHGCFDDEEEIDEEDES